jgi:ribonuclease BN (tRNA processing enzyme)
MKITFLGTASAMPDINRSQSAVLVEASGSAFLFDAGEGTFREMHRMAIEPDRIDAVFISHTHPDHAAGIPGLLQWMRLLGRTKPLSLFLPAGILRRFKSVVPAFLLNRSEWTFKYHLFPMSGGTAYEKDALRIEAVPNGHLGPDLTYEAQLKKGLDSLSFCIHESSDVKVIYTSDVEGLDHLGAVAAMANVLISECTHVETEKVMDFARQNRISRVVFTHIPPGRKQADESGFPPAVETAVSFAGDGYAFEV